MAVNDKVKAARKRLQDYPKYWDENRETMEPCERNKIILERIKHQLRYVYDNLPFYRKLYDKHNLKPEDVKTMEDFTTKVPAITKKMLVADQAENPTFGSYLGVPEKEVIRVFSSGGTTGNPTFYGISQKDWDRGAEAMALFSWTVGIRPHDTVYYCIPFGVWVGAWGYLHGIDKIGARQCTAGFVPSERHIELIRKVKPTIVISTVSGALVLAEKAKTIGYDLGETSPWLIIPGAEPGASYPSVQKSIFQAWGAEVADVGTMSEMYPPETNTMCEERNGMHVYQDEVYTEIVSKDNGNELLPYGSNGVIVYTHLYRDSQPMIRLWSGDESFMIDDPCPCGRTYPRLPKGILGRVDDMLIIRGVNIYPSAIEDILRSMPEIGVEHRIIVEKEKVLDELSVMSNCSPKFYESLDAAKRTEQMAALGEKVANKLRTTFGIRIPVEITPPGTIESTGLKARRVVDKRPKFN